jgi:hypothetical protein
VTSSAHSAAFLLAALEQSFLAQKTTNRKKREREKEQSKAKQTNYKCIFSVREHGGGTSRSGAKQKAASANKSPNDKAKSNKRKIVSSMKINSKASGKQQQKSDFSASK